MADLRRLDALFIASNAGDYLSQLKENSASLCVEQVLVDKHAEVSFVRGYCLLCERPAEFRVDHTSVRSNVTVPNWRESLVCPHCHLSNRQRMVATLVSQALADVVPSSKIYLMELVTPLMRCIRKKQARHDVTGSEYFGAGFKSGQTVWPWQYHLPIGGPQTIRSLLDAARFALRMLSGGGFRHENAEQLSFEDDSLDFIVSNDVFEHVADPVRAFAECARVLKPGGMMFATFPFYSDREKSRTRALLGAEGIEYLMPAEYHGDSNSSAGVLVFTDFGLDVFDSFRDAGFSKVQVQVCIEPGLGHLGGAPVFILTR